MTSLILTHYNQFSEAVIKSPETIRGGGGGVGGDCDHQNLMGRLDQCMEGAWTLKMVFLKSG